MKRKRNAGAVDYLWGKLVDGDTGTITSSSLAKVASQHDMKLGDKVTAMISLFSEQVGTGLTLDEFSKIFDSCGIPLDANGDIVT